MSIIAAGYIYRHLKTGNTYVVEGFCKLEATGENGVLYRKINSPITPLWARSLEEFLDGRFARADDIRATQNLRSK